MTPKESFLAHIKENRRDKTAKLVFADWLEEHADLPQSRLAFIRLQANNQELRDELDTLRTQWDATQDRKESILLDRLAAEIEQNPEATAEERRHFTAQLRASLDEDYPEQKTLSQRIDALRAKTAKADDEEKSLISQHVESWFPGFKDLRLGFENGFISMIEGSASRISAFLQSDASRDELISSLDIKRMDDASIYSLPSFENINFLKLVMRPIREPDPADNESGIINKSRRFVAGQRWRTVVSEEMIVENMRALANSPRSNHLNILICDLGDQTENLRQSATPRRAELWRTLAHAPQLQRLDTLIITDIANAHAFIDALTTATREALEHNNPIPLPSLTEISGTYPHTYVISNSEGLDDERRPLPELAYLREQAKERGLIRIPKPDAPAIAEAEPDTRHTDQQLRRRRDTGPDVSAGRI